MSQAFASIGPHRLDFPSSRHLLFIDEYEENLSDFSLRIFDESSCASSGCYIGNN